MNDKKHLNLLSLSNDKSAFNEKWRIFRVHEKKI